MAGVQLKVEASRQRDAGRGIVRIPPKYMDKLGVGAGDIVEIEGKKVTSAIVWPAYPEDNELNIIRMDGITRGNAKVGIGDTVTVRKVDVKPANKVILAPTESTTFGEGFEEYVKNYLLGRPIVQGDNIVIGVLGQPLQFIVVSTSPAGVVQISDKTRLQLQTEPAKGIETIPRVTYEDVGGLKEAVQRIREMVELPLRHPELFQRLGIDPPKGV
ncbi:MAG: CDC48 family AAA ATPase, partial [Candidatus Bathyarchaeota archaeon]